MTRRLSIAMACSAAIHLAAFVIADRFLLGDFSPSVVSTPLIVSVESPGTSPEATTRDDVVPVADATPPAAGEPQAPITPSNQSATPRSEAALPGTRELPAAESTSPAVLSAATATMAVESVSGAIGAVGNSSPANAVLVTDNADAEWSVQVRATLSPDQERMLNRKAREWVEEMHGMSQAADVSWTLDGQEYRAHFSELPANAETGIQRVLVEISTDRDGKRLSTEMQLKRLAFSSFAHFVNRWDPKVQLHDDVLDGRFHSNSQIKLAYDRQAQPVFHRMVTTAARGVDIERAPGSGRQGEMFRGGLETGVRSIRLPRDFALSPDRLNIGSDDVHLLDQDTRITFRPDGSYLRESTDSTDPGETGMLSAGTTYFVASSKTVVSVRGIVNGKVLVYSPERIVIEDDIVYEQDPEVAPDADDILGLVSDKYVEVAPPDMTGPGDLLIQAAIFAKRRFTVKKARFGQRALLFVYGSLSAGSLSATEPRYATKIRFDPRLDEMRPPGFPVTDRYELESWDADWVVEPIN